MPQVKSADGMGDGGDVVMILDSYKRLLSSWSHTLMLLMLMLLQPWLALHSVTTRLIPLSLHSYQVY